jgi:ubiquinone/menaquinone biosynthesis C-methylase UbiE
MFSEQILSFYQNYDEANRLTAGVFQLEFARTLEILQRYLPAAPAVILDVGGGPGVYSCWLAQRGYEVHLVDPVPSHLEQARQRSAQQPDFPVASVTPGDARKLEFADGCADALLMLGPLYHLIERDDRLRALREAHRVLRRGGVLFAAVISRFASALDGLRQNWLHDPVFMAIMKDDLRSGHHRNPTGELAYFTESCFHRVEELEAELHDAGFKHEQTLAIEGPGWLLQNFEDWWREPARREQLLEVIRAVEHEPGLLGASAHIMGIARKMP